ncbi:uncharacterized protein BJ212DRAFT_31339 [Suillus subaureus]|uniref:Uncharacterized protein n=1 Tax=Suillus subaureus TaxID=48587 RepID=A0A9P7EPH1_9AGAM|nr:uncharacterized protein BJ212DRAFT_31339 [Suillus subaureus]KAG1827117.1 hypothetical protein BJ212DRAFT_31339 [Suillus subaureus]
MSDDAKVWHNYHKESKAAFREGYARVQHDEETGARPDFRLKLAYVASKFRTCKSVNPNATTPGWYDKCIELTSASVRGPHSQCFRATANTLTRLHHPQLKQTTNSSGSEVTFTRPEKSSLSTASLFRESASLSELTSLPSEFKGSSAAGVFSVRESLPATRKLLGVPLANGKKRRFVMDFVSVPHPPCDGPSSSMFDDTTTQIGSLVFAPHLCSHIRY